jgi:glycosyltransferase involved in cell wall biosynthesis
MKISLFAPSTSTHTQKWALGLKQKGLDVCVITFSNHYSKTHAERVETYALPQYLPGKLSYLTTVFALRSILSQIKPDIVHAHYASSYGFVAGLARIHPLILSVWGSDIFQFPKNALNKRILSYSLSSADVLCSTSQAMLEETKKYTDKSIELIPFGVDTNHFVYDPSQKSSGEFHIGIAKSLKDIYGFPKLIEAFGKLANEEDYAHLVIIGDGPEKERYQKMVSDRGLEEKVTFVGFVPQEELPQLLTQLDLFVLPSESESFGVSALEAEACGVPVIVNNVGGLPEVVKHGETGMIIPNNDPQEIYKAMKTLLNDDYNRHQMEVNAVRFVKENYQWEDCVQKTVAIYEKNLTNYKVK